MQSKDYDVIANQSNQINQNNNAVKTMTCEIRYIFIFECHFENDSPALHDSPASTKKKNDEYRN